MSRIIMALPLVICMFFLTSAQSNDGKSNSRIYNKEQYRVVDADGFVIYSRDVHVVGSKARVTEKKYYFSKDDKSEIKPLTINNLKHAYPQSRQFHELIDVYFRDNQDLTRYDAYYKEYKLKSVFRQAFN